MSYVLRTRGPGENILMRAQFNWTYSVPSMLWCLIGCLPLAYLVSFHIMTGTVPGNVAWIYTFSAVPAVFGMYVFISHLIHLTTTEIMITSSRFVFKRGLVARNTKEVSLNMIEEISLEQSILGRIFGYGHLTIRGSGVGLIKLPDVNAPITVRQCIEGAKAALRHQMAGNTTQINSDNQSNAD